MQQVFHLAFTFSNSGKNTKNKSNVFEVNKKDIGCFTCFSCFASLVAFYSTVVTAEFEQTNAGWVWEYIVSDNKFVVQ